MPVLIVNNGSETSINNGTVRIADLTKMTGDYKNQVALTPIPPRNVVTKRFSFYFSKEQLETLLLHYSETEGADAIEVSLGIQVPGSITTCNPGPNEIITDNSNCLGVIISMARRADLTSFNEENDFVLINGYHPAATFDPIAECCPGSHPPPDLI